MKLHSDDNQILLNLNYGNYIQFYSDSIGVSTDFNQNSLLDETYGVCEYTDQYGNSSLGSLLVTSSC